MKYHELLKLIEDLERKWQRKLKDELSCNPDKPMIQGEVQFFSVENVSRHAAPDIELPIIVAVGINYTQSDKRETYPTPSVKKSTGNLVEDYDPKMRLRLSEAFEVFNRPGMSKKWHERHHASSPSIPVPSDGNYFLVASNFCPFITFYEWTNSERDKCYRSAERANLLCQLDGEFQYLDDLAESLKDSQQVIWVGHGLHSEVFVLFRLWQRRHKLTPWLLTANLARPYRWGTGAPFWSAERNCPCKE